jgi:hypothetical protein
MDNMSKSIAPFFRGDGEYSPYIPPLVQLFCKALDLYEKTIEDNAYCTNRDTSTYFDIQK